MKWKQSIQGYKYIAKITSSRPCFSIYQSQLEEWLMTPYICNVVFLHPRLQVLQSCEYVFLCLQLCKFVRLSYFTLHSGYERVKERIQSSNLLYLNLKKLFVETISSEEYFWKSNITEKEDWSWKKVRNLNSFVG